MDPKQLPILGPITNGDKDFYRRAAKLKGKHVLLIGFTEAEADEYVAKYEPQSITMLTKWEGHVDAAVKKYQLYMGDICTRTDFKENLFDSVLTLSVLEHLDNLEGAVIEMTRITKNGGDILHIFGPTWSCAYGHHIYEKADDPLLNFSLWAMPAHMHLLCSRDEIVNFYVEQGYKKEAGNAALHWFFETPIINRLFFDDYLNIFSAAPLQLDSQELMYNLLPSDHLHLLRSAFPRKSDFGTYGAKMRFIVNK